MPSSTDTQVPELIINTLTKAQYNTLLQNNQIEANQLYMTKDEDYYLASNVTYGTTTYAQITSMLTDNIEPVCYYNGYRYNYAGLDTYYYFTCVTSDSVKYIRVNSSNTWSNNSYQIQSLISDLNTIRTGATQGASAYTMVQNLATVATSGSYTDLTDKPSIPTVNNVTISFTQGGVDKGSFTLNQSSGTTIASLLDTLIQYVDIVLQNDDSDCSISFFIL